MLCHFVLFLTVQSAMIVLKKMLEVDVGSIRAWYLEAGLCLH